MGLPRQVFFKDSWMEILKMVFMKKNENKIGIYLTSAVFFISIYLLFLRCRCITLSHQEVENYGTEGTGGHLSWRQELAEQVQCVLCTLCAVYCVLCTVYWVLCTVYCVLCTVYCVLYTVYCVLCTVYCVLCTEWIWGKNAKWNIFQIVFLY